MLFKSQHFGLVVTSGVSRETSLILWRVLVQQQLGNHKIWLFDVLDQYYLVRSVGRILGSLFPGSWFSSRIEINKELNKFPSHISVVTVVTVVADALCGLCHRHRYILTYFDLSAHLLPHVATCCSHFPWKFIRGKCGTSAATPFVLTPSGRCSLRDRHHWYVVTVDTYAIIAVTSSLRHLRAHSQLSRLAPCLTWGHRALWSPEWMNELPSLPSVLPSSCAVATADCFPPGSSPAALFTRRLQKGGLTSLALRVRGNHLSNTTCITQLFFKSDEWCSNFKLAVLDK